MKATELIRLSIDSSKMWAQTLLEDLREAPLTAPTASGGNHPLWILGHLAVSESGLVYTFCRGEESPLAAWRELFGRGTTAIADASQYPAFDELMTKFEEVRGETLAYLDSIAEEDLGRKSHAPADRAAFFGTIGQCLNAIAVHTAFHAGQLADARRSLGRQPLVS